MDVFLLPRCIQTRANLYGLVSISHGYFFFAKMCTSKYKNKSIDKNKKHVYSNIVVRQCNIVHAILTRINGYIDAFLLPRCVQNQGQSLTYSAILTNMFLFLYYISLLHLAVQNQNFLKRSIYEVYALRLFTKCFIDSTLFFFITFFLVMFGVN